MLPQSSGHGQADPLFVGRRFQVVAFDAPGVPSRREVVVHPGAVVILPLLDRDGRTQVIMIRNRRMAVDQTLWELPAGTREQGRGDGPSLEDPVQCAARELIEETGYEARNLKKLSEFYTSPGFCTELIHAYLATELKHVGQNLEESEMITVEVLPWEKTMDMIRRNMIRDAKTMMTLLFYQVFYMDRN